MRATVSGLRSSGRLKARETLERSTPTSLATWLIVTGVRIGFALILASFAARLAGASEPRRIRQKFIPWARSKP
jgi:hypothetical protein